jgi:alpha/beta superfamily hydrolase
MPIPISAGAQTLLIPGPAGAIEAVLDTPAAVAPRGLALVAHPHPLYGGTLDNKVVQTLARVMLELGYRTLRPNFRGVGASEGQHDEGLGETEDLLAVLDYARAHFGAAAPVLCGFSFGAFVQTRVAQRITPERMVLVGVANGRVAAGRDYRTEAVPENTLVIHGENDETVPLANVFDWARPQSLPVVVIPGCDHFFHRKLHIIRNIVAGSW